MKFMLTVETSDATALARILANCNGTAVVTATDDDDDNAPVNTAAPAVDGNGLPWDERIHSSNKQLTAKGVWRARKNVQPAEVTRVEAELRARAVNAGVAAVTASAAPVVPPPPGFPATPPGMPPVPAAAPVVPPPPPAQPAGMTFAEFMAKYSAAVNAGKVTQPELQLYLTACGIAQLGDLNTDPSKIPMVHDYMAANGKL